MTLVLDAGAFLAVERADRDTVALIKRELMAARVPLTHAGVVAQVWRGGGGRQASLARLLPAVDVVPLDERLAKQAGVLLRKSRSSDAIDAAVVLLAVDGDMVLTSDIDDLRPLAAHAAIHVDIVRV